MEIEPEGLESNLETGVLRKNRLKHYLAVAALLALGCAVVWFLASLQMYSNSPMSTPKLSANSRPRA